MIPNAKQPYINYDFIVTINVNNSSSFARKTIFIKPSESLSIDVKTDKNEYKPGDCLCAAPGGTVDIMTREEIKEYPDRIVGTVSCVPEYEEWGGGEMADRKPVKVNGRIWVKVK